MKTKHYEFTDVEVLAIREALDTFWHIHIKDRERVSPIYQKTKDVTKPLLDAFTTDYEKMIEN